MNGIRTAPIKTHKAYPITPEERARQARLRLLAAAEIRRKSPSLKKTIGISAVAGAFVAGFIAGFSPSVSRAVSREIVSLVRLWGTKRIIGR